MNFFVSLVAVLALAAIAGLGAQSGGMRTLIGVYLPYVAFALFIFGFIARMVQWGKVPVPFRIPTTCGQQKSHPWIAHAKIENPTTTSGVLARMFLEVVCFRSLFRNSSMAIRDGKAVYGYTKWLWLGAILFHYSFLIVLLRHLRFFAEPVPGFVLVMQELDGFVQVGVPVFYITSFGLLAGVSYLLLRRLYIPQVRYISLANDYFPLLLILGIALTGFLLRHYAKTDLMAVKELAIGVVTFSPIAGQKLAGVHWLFFVHLFFVTSLFAYFPFSKLMHMGGVFLSPTRNLANNNRMVRHINPWNPKVKVHTYEEWEDDFREKMKQAGLPVEKE